MPDISQLKNVLSYLEPRKVQLVAVSKTKPVADIEEVYKAGQRIFGENRVQELVDKQPVLPADIEWHMIGHLQTNKVKYIAPFIALLLGVDSLKLLIEINKQAAKNDRVIPCLLQMHIARESTKFGMEETELEALLNDAQYKALRHVNIKGLMGMATFTDDSEQVRREFRTIKSTFEKIKTGYFSNQPAFQTLSIGMTNDYLVAIDEGATMVRIGSLLFGSRTKV